jgi:hypothetical protein
MVTTAVTVPMTMPAIAPPDSPLSAFCDEPVLPDVVDADLLDDDDEGGVVFESDTEVVKSLELVSIVVLEGSERELATSKHVNALSTTASALVTTHHGSCSRWVYLQY